MCTFVTGGAGYTLLRKLMQPCTPNRPSPSPCKATTDSRSPRCGGLFWYPRLWTVPPSPCDTNTILELERPLRRLRLSLCGGWRGLGAS